MGPVALGVPARIGSYEPLFPIGSGGMATVYLARRIEPDGAAELYALKLTHPHLRSKEGRARELITEARVAVRIQHPNVVPVLEVGEDAHGVYLVMAYVEGDSLAGLVRAAAAANERVPLSVALAILCGALDGLHIAHEARGDDGSPLGLVHRDFSPQNILVGVDGIARLTDFGIAKSRDNDAVTESGVVKGKFAYMAPEQLRGRELDRRADVWAAGVVAWELCTGERLFGEGDQVANMLRLVTEKPRRARAIVPDLPQALDDAIAAALEIDVRRRCATALELANALRAAMPIADAATVGAYVRRLAHAELAERAGHIAEAMRQRSSARTAPSKTRTWMPFAALGLVVATSVAMAALQKPKVVPSSSSSSSSLSAAAGSSSATAAMTPAPPAADSGNVPATDSAVTPSPTTRPSTPPAPVASAKGGRPKPHSKPTGTRPSTSGGSLLDNPYKNE